MEEKPGRGDHLKGHQFAKGVSGNVKGKPPGTISRKTIFKAVLDSKLKATHEIVVELKEKYPLMFVGKQKAYSIEELVTIVHIARAITVGRADNVRIDILNRIHGKPLQAVVTMDHTTPIEETMTSEQTREALERVREANAQFEQAKKYKRTDGQDQSEG